MRSLVIIPLVLLFSMSLLGASSVDYEVFDNKVLVNVQLDDVQGLEYRIPSDAKVFEINSVDFTIEKIDGFNLLKVSDMNDLEFSYITESLIDNGERNFFVLKNNFSEDVDVTLFLPEGGFLIDAGQSLVFPNADDITTDGRRIILEWMDFSDEEIVVAYEFPKETDYLFVLFIVLVVIFGILYYRHSRLRVGKKKKEIPKKIDRKKKVARVKKDITRNLFGEEKKIVEYLFEKPKKESWTKEVVRDLGISKVKLSRRLRSLEQKGLIEKIPYGNENRIRLVKRN